jgi:predicted nuclease with RNAse H fold
MDVVAIDWSGDATAAGQRRHIWVAVVRDGQMIYLKSGHTRDEVVDRLIAAAEVSQDLIVGFDFAFSYPAWFFQTYDLADVGSLWDLVTAEGERWLKECQPPFWGRPGTTKPRLPDHFRETDRACKPVGGIAPKSVFQIGGAGSVGTGSIRGMPYLSALRDAGFSIWPFDPPRLPLVVEIYPRALTGAVNKSNPTSRQAYLVGRTLPAALLPLAEQSDDALDAAISALVMNQNLESLRDPSWSAGPAAALEGATWFP